VGAGLACSLERLAALPFFMEQPQKCLDWSRLLEAFRHHIDIYTQHFYCHIHTKTKQSASRRPYILYRYRIQNSLYFTLQLSLLFLVLLSVFTRTTMAAVEKQQLLPPNQSVLSNCHEQRRKSYQEPPQLELQTCIASRRAKSLLLEEIQTPASASAPSSGRRASWREMAPSANDKSAFQVMKEATEQARACVEQEERQIPAHLAARPFAQHDAAQPQPQRRHIKATCIQQVLYRGQSPICIQALYRGHSARKVLEEEDDMLLLSLLEDTNHTSSSTIATHSITSIVLKHSQNTTTSDLYDDSLVSLDEQDLPCLSNYLSQIDKDAKWTPTLTPAQNSMQQEQDTYHDLSTSLNLERSRSKQTSSFSSYFSSSFCMDSPVKPSRKLTPPRQRLRGDEEAGNNYAPFPCSLPIHTNKGESTIRASEAGQNHSFSSFFMDSPVRPPRRTLSPMARRRPLEESTKSFPLRQRLRGDDEAGNDYAPFPCSLPIHTNKGESTIRASEAGQNHSFSSFFMDSPVRPPRRTLSPMARRRPLEESTKSFSPSQPLRKESLHNPKSTRVSGRGISVLQSPTTPMDAGLLLSQHRQSRVQHRKSRVPEQVTTVCPLFYHNQISSFSSIPYEEQDSRFSPHASNDSNFNDGSPRSVFHLVEQRAMEAKERRRDILIHQAKQQEGPCS
jgi:hypothetical protein